MLTCFCGIVCANGASLSQHMVTAHQSNFLLCCEICKRCFKTAHSLIVHKQIHFKAVTFPCWKCFRRFRWKSRCDDHAANCQIGGGHSNRRGTPSSDFVLTSIALVDSVKVYAFHFPEGFIDIDMNDTLLYVNAANLILAEL